MRNTLQDIGILDFYQNKNRIKWLIFISSVVISFGSIYYTNILVEELKDREKRQIELLARALEYASSASIDAENLSFITS
jgi:negative regulator of genetic competence, sporulation and motility